MPTKTPMTAAEAAELATRLAQAERDLADRKRTARKAAEVAECQALLDGPDRDLAAELQDAAAEWDRCVGDLDADIPQLFCAYQAWRIASVRRAAHVGTASGHWDGIEPVRHETSGQPIGHRGDTHDTATASGLTWPAALDQALNRRLAIARSAITLEVQKRIDDAGHQAAEATK